MDGEAVTDKELQLHGGAFWIVYHLPLENKKNFQCKNLAINL